MLSGILNILKPSGMTSHDVVYFVRKATGVKKVGHAGTLDPDAAGVLPVFVGNATRLIEYTADSDKCYRAELLLGVKTDTGDSSGNIIDRKPLPELSNDAILAALEKLTGDTLQIPPMYSAVKYKGQKLYQLARAGQTVERAARPIKIYSLKLLAREKDRLLLEIDCSKGTYIRTLLEDIAEGLETVGTMDFLLRTKAGSFLIEKTCLLEDIKSDPAKHLLSADLAVAHLPLVTLDQENARRFSQGVKTEHNGAPHATVRVCSPDGSLLGIGTAKEGLLRAKKVLTANKDCGWCKV